VSGHVIVTGTASADIEGARTVTATCTSGKYVVGGGWITSNISNGAEINISDSYPSSSTVWTVVGRNDNTSGDTSYSLQAYAICVTIP
jgi:hypothetical protein